MATAQPGIFVEATRVHVHLEFDLRSDVAVETLRGALASLRYPKTIIVNGVNVIVGFGAELWAALAPDGLKAHPFPVADGLAATPHDVWVWLHGDAHAEVFDAARAVATMVESAATLAQEVHGFVYRDNRDLIGFVDGTENPSVDEAPTVAIRGNDEIGAGCSFALVQRWVHDLGSFNALEVAEQEDVIGRTKADSVELDEDRMPPNSHVARMVVEVDGEELEIYRRSIPYGTATEHGLHFIAFSADPTRFDVMLARMFGTSDDGLRDRLAEFSRPVSGAYYVVPSIDDLDAALA